MRRLEQLDTMTKDPRAFIQAAAVHFGLSRSALVDVHRRRSCARLMRSRATLAWVLCERLGLTYREIGRLLGGRDHSTAFYWVRAAGGYPSLQEDVGQIEKLTEEGTLSEENKEERQGDRMAELIAQNLETVPAEILPSEHRLAAAQGMIGFLGLLVEFWEQHKPMTATKAAAFMFFVEQLHIDHTSEANAFVMVKLVEGARRAKEVLRKEIAS
jgi:hypothetical protein